MALDAGGNYIPDELGFTCNYCKYFYWLEDKTELDDQYICKECYDENREDQMALAKEYSLRGEL